MSSVNGALPDPNESSPPASWRAKLSTVVSIRTQRRKWGGRTDTWDEHNDSGMETVSAKAIAACDIQPGMDCVDLGCGTGRLALLLAERGARVIGVDISPAMIERMRARAVEDGYTTVRGVVTPIEYFTLPSESVDLVITNYALHHLLDADKAKVVTAAFGWLKPGGQLVVADMMLGRGLTSRDRNIIASKVRTMAQKGPPGYWRILKNAGRFLFRVHERPITPQAWVRLLEEAGFDDLSISTVVLEAAVVKGVRPIGSLPKADPIRGEP